MSIAARLHVSEVAGSRWRPDRSGPAGGGAGLQTGPTEEPEQIMPEPAAGTDLGAGTDQEAPTNEPAGARQATPTPARTTLQS